MAERAFESAFLAVVRAAMDVLMDAVGKLNSLAHGLCVDETSEIDPFPTVFRPSLSSECDGNFPGNYRLFQRSQVLARHLVARHTAAAMVDAVPVARIVCSRSGPTETISTGRPTSSLSRFR